MPELRLVVLALQDKLAYGTTFQAALALALRRRGFVAQRCIRAQPAGAFCKLGDGGEPTAGACQHRLPDR